MTGPPGYGAPPPPPPPPYGPPPPPPYGPPPPPPYGPPPYGPPPYGPPPQRPLPPYPHERPEPYHRTLRTWTYRPWRVLVGLPLAVVLGVLVGPLLVTLLVVAGVELLGVGSAGEVVESLDLTGGLTPPTLLIVNLSLAVLVPVTWLIVRYLHNLRPRWLGSVRPGLRWRLLAACFGLALLATLVATGLASVLLPEELPTAAGAGERAQSTGTTIAFLVIIGLTSPLQSAGEEYFFRGYLLQGFGALVRAPWFALTFTSLLFAVAHGSQNLPLFVDRFAFGLVAGGLVLLTGGLEAGIALHIVNNVVVLGLAAATGALPQTLATSEASWSLVVFDLGQFVLYALVVLALCRAWRTASRTPGPPDHDAVDVAA